MLSVLNTKNARCCLCAVSVQRAPNSRSSIALAISNFTKFVSRGVLSKGGFPLVFIPPFDTIFFIMSQIDDYLRSGRTPNGIDTDFDYSDGTWIPGGRTPTPDFPDEVPESNFDSPYDSGTYRDEDGISNWNSEGGGFDIDLPSNGSDSNDRPSSFDAFLHNLLNDPDLYNITDRSQIINPEEILSRFKFGTSDAEVARYNKALAALRNIQAQQEAAFQEWYNSTSQQAIRDRQAGLNTDILGISGQSTASGATQQSGSPLDGIATAETRRYEQESLRLQKFQSVMSAVSSICTIPASFASAFGSAASGASALQAMKGQKLANLENFEKLAGSEISSRLSDAISSSLALGQSLDIGEWFGDDANFEGIMSTYAPDQSQAYAGSFANLRSRMQRSLGSAYAEGKVTAENQGSFSGLLADPRYSSDQLVQIAHLKPYMKARTDLQLLNDEFQAKVTRLKDSYVSHLDAQSAVDAANAKFEFEGKYYSNRDGAAEALQEWYQKEADGIVARMRSSIQHNLFDMYDKNQNNERGFAAAYLSSANSVTWYESLIAQELMFGIDRLKDRPSSPSPWNGVELPSTNPPDSMGASPSPSTIRGFMPPGSVGF